MDIRDVERIRRIWNFEYFLDWEEKDGEVEKEDRLGTDFWVFNKRDWILIEKFLERKRKEIFLYYILIFKIVSC